jgi:hypothetical protein
LAFQFQTSKLYLKMKIMDEKTLKALVSAGAVKRIRIIGNGVLFHVEADTPNGSVPALTLKGTPKTWRTLDAAAKWVRGLGVGSAQVELARWQPGQVGLKL